MNGTLLDPAFLNMSWNYNLTIPRPSFGTNTYLWYDASTLSLNDGDAVSQWNDISVNARHVIQTNASKRPTYQSKEINLLPCVRFDGVDDFLTNTGSLDINGAYYVTMVARINEGCIPNGGIFTGNETTYDYSANDGNRAIGRSFYVHAGYQDDTYPSGLSVAWRGKFMPNIAMPTGSFFIYSWFINGNGPYMDCVVRQGGKLKYQNSVLKPGNTSPARERILVSRYSLGSRLGPGATYYSFGKVDIAELMMFAPANLADRNNVDQYFSLKYNLPYVS